VTVNVTDEASKFMEDLIKLLAKEASNVQTGESVSGTEEASSILLRILGLTKVPVYGEVDRSEIPPGTLAQTSDTLVDTLFKVKNKSAELQLKQISTLLKTYKSKVARQSKARTNIKLKRTQKLAEEADNPIVAEDLVKDTPEQTQKAIAEKQKELREKGDLKGIINQDIQLQKALELSVSRSVDIPENSGPFAGQLTSLVNATGKQATDRIEKLNSLKKELQGEVNKLQNTEKLLFEGMPVLGQEDQKISLLSVIDLLIFLTDRKQMKYDCSQCIFYREGRSNACTFIGAGISSAPLVNLTDEEGNPIIGRLTKPNNSCKEVWNLETNQYFTAADKIVAAAKKMLES
jgi:hypothetical protein